MYRVFVRDWWKPNPKWPNGREPDSSGIRRTLAEDVETIDEARELCEEYNSTHDPGPLSRKAEFERT